MLALLIIAIGTVTAAPHVAAQLKTWKMLPQTEEFTAIYFTSPGSVPTSYSPGQPQALSFTTTNRYQTTQQYSYQVFTDTPTGVALLSAGSFHAAAGTDHHTDVTVTPADVGPRIRIAIVVADGNDQQTLTYWATRE